MARVAIHVGFDIRHRRPPLPLNRDLYQLGGNEESQCLFSFSANATSDRPVPSCNNSLAPQTHHVSTFVIWPTHLHTQLSRHARRLSFPHVHASHLYTPRVRRTQSCIFHGESWTSATWCRAFFFFLFFSPLFLYEKAHTWGTGLTTGIDAIGVEKVVSLLGNGKLCYGQHSQLLVMVIDVML